MESPLDVAKRTGTWWTNPWWEGEIYQAHSHMSVSAIRDAVEVLKNGFDARWTQKAIKVGPPNAVLARLVGGTGLWFFEDIMTLARTISALSGAQGLARKLNDLIGERTHATLFELQIAELLGGDGWALEFPPESTSPTPDIVASKAGRIVAIECKKLGEELWEEWARQLGIEALRAATGFHMRQDRAVDIEFDQRLSELLTSDEDASRGLLDEILSRVSGAAASLLEQETVPAEVDIACIASIAVSPRREGHAGSAGGIEISEHRKTRRIIQNGVLRALPQLDRYENSLVAVFSENIPRASLFDVAMSGYMRGKARQFPNLAAVLVVSHSATYEFRPPFLWTHPSPKDAGLLQEISTSLRKSLPLV